MFDSLALPPNKIPNFALIFGCNHDTTYQFNNQYEKGLEMETRKQEIGGLDITLCGFSYNLTSIPPRY